ncbi:efflux RND transporter permease subunit [Paenibacillus chartarius]|uniref:Efflux RND transporter permease subunit n=1 Tax=Paenibacillus chartarius TaxID=747481 RepID=A0ABV6DV17_9BACL
MRSLIRFSLHNKFALFFVTLLVTAAGLYAGASMKQETLPNMEMPVLTLTTVLPGAAPQAVADQITAPLEQRLRGLSDIDTFSSTSMENVSSILVQYRYGQDMAKAKADLQDAIAQVTLPDSAQPVKIGSFSLNEFPVISLSLTGDDRKVDELTRIVDGNLRPALESIAGVGTVSISGQQLQEVQIRPDTARLQANGVTVDTIRSVLQNSAVTMPLGLFELEGAEKTLVVDGGIHTLEQLRSLALPLAGGAAGPGGGPGAIGAAPAPGTAAGIAAPAALPTVRLADVAAVDLVTRSESISRTNGKPSIGIQVTKTSGANTVDVVNSVKAEVSRLEKEQPGIQTLILLDQGKPIEESVHTMLSKALFGALFAIIVIMLFLRNLRTTLISIVSIPLSLVIALLLLQRLGITLNIMTLGAMTVAIGRVVDDSIVVIENNYRRMRLSFEKLSGEKLVIAATREMFMPIFSSTLVTIAVFLPLGLVTGPIGQMFLPFALTMVFALLASLLVSITVVPALTHVLFRRRLGSLQDRNHEERTGFLARSYRGMLSWALDHKWITSTVAVLLLLGSLALAGVVGFSFLPEEEQKFALVTYNPGPGRTAANTEQTAAAAEKLILARQGVMDLQYSIGGNDPMSGGAASDRSARFQVFYANDFANFAEEKKALLETLQTVDPSGSWEESDYGGGVGGNKLRLNVYGQQESDIRQAVESIQDTIRQDAGFTKVGSSLTRTYEQLTFVLNQPKLASFGLTSGQIAMQLTPMRARTALAAISDNGRDVPVYMEAQGPAYGSLSDIQKQPIGSPVAPGALLQDVSEVRKGVTASGVTRKNGKLYAEVTATITAKDVGKASAAVQSRIAALSLPASVTIDYGGVTQQMNETFRQLGLAIAAAVAIVYLLLVLTFGGAVTPFVILFSLPFAVIGALVALFVAGETISASAMMGALMLIGIVVTNAIVLIDRVLHMEKEGVSTREALLEAAETRLRPILMTALATIGALLPLALGFESGGSGTLISKGLGVTVIGGLISSTLLTLLIVPIVYELLARPSRRSRTKSRSG